MMILVSVSVLYQSSGKKSSMISKKITDFNEYDSLSAKMNSFFIISETHSGIEWQKELYSMRLFTGAHYSVFQA